MGPNSQEFLLLGIEFVRLTQSVFNFDASLAILILMREVEEDKHQN